MQFPKEVWYNIKHYDMTFEEFEQYLLEYEKELKKKWNVKDNEEDTSA